MAKKSYPTDNCLNKTLSNICKGNPYLENFFANGLGALKKNERKSVKVPDTSMLCGSVDLDNAAKEMFPHENRWDYALEYDGTIFFIEIHPASTSEIDCIVKKVDFVTKWLKEHAPEILALPLKNNQVRQFYWVSSGNTDLRITPKSQQARKLALRNIQHVGKVWDYTKIIK